MKGLTIITFLILFTSSFVFSQISVNTDGSLPDGSAMLDVKSNNKGLLPPRMARAEINAIVNPANGLIVYCIDCGPGGTGALSMFMAGSWIRLATAFMEPTVTTSAAISITQTTATCGGIVTSDGGTPVIARGVCLSKSANPIITDSSKTTDGTGTSSFTSSLTGLIENTTYYIRAYATNSAGTGYGNEITFKTLANAGGIIFNPDLTYGTMTDIDGNEYKTITIGTQTWMAENIKTTKYRNGDPIPNVTDDAAWAVLATGAYCWYNNDPANKANYGALYNWFAVADSRNIAPAGWHVATDAEWTTLVTFLGGESVASGKLKESGISHWMYPNTNATNSSGFTALPGGYRFYYEGFFVSVSGYGFWWSSTANDANNAWYLCLNYYDAGAYNYGNKKSGFSVRCVRN